MFNSNPFSLGQLPTATFSGANKIECLVNTIGKCINAALPVVEAASEIHTKKHHRRTDEELNQDTSGTDKFAKDFQHRKQMPLSAAMNCAQSSPGVYVLYLNGIPMKCGRASYSGGVSWRLRQYYNLNYDNRARMGDYWSVSPQNRNNIMVSWQCCPPSKCHELEYKLFKKYGKGAWAQRAPVSCDTDSWALLI